jgi:hypothetical protein
MLSVIMLSVLMLGCMLNVVMLNVVAPSKDTLKEGIALSSKVFIVFVSFSWLNTPFRQIPSKVIYKPTQVVYPEGAALALRHSA